MYTKFFKKTPVIIFLFFLSLNLNVNYVFAIPTLDKIINDLSNEYKFTEIEPKELNDLLKINQVNDYLIFDVRERDEYQISHLKNSIWIDPDLDADEFFNLFSDKIKGKKLIFYCSVGYRSSKMIKKIKSFSKITNEKYNLKGGIFKWFNMGFKLYDLNGVTKKIHPYNKRWSKLLKPLN